MPLVIKLVVALLVAELALAQSGGIFTGTVDTTTGVPVSNAQVLIQDEATGLRQSSQTDNEGRYESTELAPGQYRFTIRCKGFRTLHAFGVALTVGESRRADFIMTLLPVHEEMTVVSTPDRSDPTATGIAVERHDAANNLPENGRDLHALYNLLPGAVLTPAASADGGQFSVTGQRPNTNTFRIDGISGNTGVGISAVPGAFPGSTLPAMSAIGSTQGLTSHDEIERVEMRSSDFAPEYGDRPGAQIIVETRSGGNERHGNVLGFLRPRLFDSDDWFARRYHFPLEPASSRGYALSAGGPLISDRTFLFAALEQTGVHDTASQVLAVPSFTARKSAPASDAVLLDAFPNPTGPPLQNEDEAVAVAPLTKSATERSYTIRLDQNTGANGRLFARLAAMPSISSTDYLGNARAKLFSASATIGFTRQSGLWIHDLRLNYSNASTRPVFTASPSANAAFIAIAPVVAENSQASVGSGASTLSYEPSSINSLAALSIEGVGQLFQGKVATSRQSQAESRYTVSRARHSHSFEAGLDFIGIIPYSSITSATTSAVCTRVSNILKGDPVGLTLALGKSAFNSLIPIGSFFAQDTWHVAPRLTLLYGLRWEATPRSNSPFSSQLFFGDWQGPGSLELLSGYGGSVNSLGGNRFWPNRYGQLAPRFGLAYQISPRWVLRAGAGLFYDNALGSLVDPLNLSPLNTWQYVPGTKLGPPTSLANSEPPLFLPRTWEWRTSAEHALTTKSTVAVAYVGSSGSRLLREQATLLPDTVIPADVHFTSSGHSSFHALEAQIRGNLSARLYALVSYTWSHSIDNGSQDGALFLTAPGYGRQTDRGSSNFDIRHSLTSSASWNPAWMKGFVLSSTLQARTGFPFDVTTMDRTIGLGFANSNRPDLISDVPLWIPDLSSPIGRRINPQAFQLPSSQNGNLGRNALSGPGLLQVDTSLRRRFRIGDRYSLELTISAFNLFNRANFANPVGYLGSAFFGQPVSMQSLMLGSGSPNTGITPIFQNGGPRTAEVGVTFRF